MRQAVLLLLTAAVAIASPVLIPIAAVLHARDRRRMQVAPSEALCECCGATLGAASWHRADKKWAEYVNSLHHD
jgi:hypothetical protein